MKLTPWTKRLIVIAGAGIIIAAMFTGNFDAIVEMIGKLMD